jgi:hypothetical protein
LNARLPLIAFSSITAEIVSFFFTTNFESHCRYAAKPCVLAYQQSMDIFILIVGTPAHISKLHTNNGVKKSYTQRSSIAAGGGFYNVPPCTGA